MGVPQTPKPANQSKRAWDREVLDWRKGATYFMHNAAAFGVSKTSEFLRTKKIDVINSDNADRHDYKNTLIIQFPKKSSFAEFCSLCGSVGVVHFEEEGDIKMHRCLRCLAQWDDCSISKQDTTRGRLLNG